MPPNSEHPLSRHSMKRRSKANDYRARRIYMITFTKAAGIPEFGRLSGDPSYPHNHPMAPRVIVSDLGNAINSAIMSIDEINEHLEIIRHVIMPDHVHFIVNVKAPIARHLGKYLALLKTKITKAMWALYPYTAELKASAFDRNFHDRILLKRGQLNVMKKYVADNPRRLAVKRKYPEFFRRLMGVRIGEDLYDCYGNPFLLQMHDKMAVKVRSFWSDQDFHEHLARWMAMVYNGAVLVSPFISAREKIVRDEALEAGGSVIILCDEAFPDRFKPPGREFELCQQGRLLLIHPHALPDRGDRHMTREIAETLNRASARIASLTTEPMTFVSKRQ